jgi:hypothetical protein
VRADHVAARLARARQQVYPARPDDAPQRPVPPRQPGSVKPHRRARHKRGHHAKNILRGKLSFVHGLHHVNQLTSTKRV